MPVELIVNGYPVATKEIPADGSVSKLSFDYVPERSSWVAVRIFPAAHTNPIFVEVDGQPIRAAGYQARLAAGQFAAIGTMFAVLDAEESGQGQLVDVSAQECVVMAHETAVQFYDSEKFIRRRSGGTERRAGHGVYPCKDGHIYLLVGMVGQFWGALLNWLDPTRGRIQFEPAPGAGRFDIAVVAMCVPFALFTALVITAPLALPEGSVTDLSGGVGTIENRAVTDAMPAPWSWLYALGDAACHQKPERSFFLGGNEMPFCARDLAIFAGIAGALAACQLLDRQLQMLQPALTELGRSTHCPSGGSLP